ncbi:MAG: sulfatase-like hydrolase/transferase [Bryobacteraceae bacterium]|nr:sulfatase-like hydrolase/transferase [Bryobacteraceae bacterium]MDW8378000.1 sulfatase-like hydrolase/transferase [Bryobacterales bacterium]
MRQDAVRGKLGRRTFLTATAAGASFGQSKNNPPNILYIMTDQQHAGMMSCTGNRWLKTPAMDSLAAQGVRFELAYASNPVCMPARTSMMTGHYPSRFEMRGNGPGKVPPEIMASSLGHLFRRANYRTVFGGKTHWPAPMTPQRIGFEYLTHDERQQLAETCASFLREKHDRPFLLVASFINPHDICYMAIDAYTKASNLPAMYPNSSVERQCLAEASALPAGVSREEFFRKYCPPLPANHAPTRDEPHALGRYESFRGWARKNWKEEDWRLHRWAYCRLTERVDAEIAIVLKALRETGLDRNTLVVFSSDHGDMDAAHGFEHKSLPYEESARVPFIVSWPGHTPAGRVDRKHLVSSSVDLLPTLCDYAGIEPPPGLPGRSIRRIVESGSAPGWRDDLVIECIDSRCLRTRRYKYSVFVGPGQQELLVDLEKDPGETVNLAGHPRYQTILSEHRQRLRTRMQAVGDRWGLALLEELDRSRAAPSSLD